MSTLKDIALTCRCTISTASRALRGDGRIGADTIARVQAAAKRLGYRPNLAARTLVTGRTRTVLFLTGELSSHTNHLPAEAAAKRCRHHGLDLLVATHHGDAATHRRLIDRIGQGLADGVLVAADAVDRDSVGLRALVRARFPVVFVDRHVPGLVAPVVTTDNAASASALVELLAAAGASWIGDGFSVHNPVEDARSAGVIAACRRLGLRRIAMTEKTALPTHGPIACLSSVSQRLRNLIARGDDPRRPLLAGVFDHWTGDPPSGSQVWIAEQDFAAMAATACDRLALRIEGVTDPTGNAPTFIAPLRIRRCAPPA